MQGQWQGKWQGQWLGGGDASGNPVVFAALAVTGSGSAFMAPELLPATTFVIAGLFAAGTGAALLGAQLLTGEPPIAPPAIAPGGGVSYARPPWRWVPFHPIHQPRSRRRRQADILFLGR